MSALQRKFFLVLALLLALQASTNFIKYCSEKGRFGGDFISFWGASQNLAHGDTQALYDPDRLKTYLKSYDTSGRNMTPPIIYPPHILPLLWPMENLTYNQAVALWSLIPLFFYFALVFLAIQRSELMREEKSSRRLGTAVVIAILLPLLSANLFAGETGAFMAVLFLTMACCWTRYPALAGICIGVMTVKPQLGLLIPFALIASGNWYIMAAAILTVISMFAFTTAWLGASVWANYLQMTGIYSGLLAKGSHSFDNLAVGPYISLHGAGLPADVATALQVIITLGVMGVIIRVFRDRDEGRQDMRFALLACGTLLAAPNTMCYDSPLLAAALVPFMARAWHRNASSVVEIVALTAVVIMPYAQLIMMPLHVPSSLLSLLLFFIVLRRRYNAEAG